jgi:glycyl-tRNA synthetase beta chain
MFFYKNDIRNGLSNEGLKKLVFVEGLGSMYDKCEREAIIADYLGRELLIKEPIDVFENLEKLKFAMDCK